MVDIDKWLVETNIQFDNIKKGELSIFFQKLYQNYFKMGNAYTEKSLHVVYQKYSIIRLEFSRDGMQVFSEKPNNGENNNRDLMIQKIINGFEIPENIKCLPLTSESLNSILEFILKARKQLLGDKKYLEKLISTDEVKNQLELINYNEIGMDTESIANVKIRKGQALFRNSLMTVEPKCKICGLKYRELLIASHIKPWKDCNDFERLDPNNGFLLCPNHDKLFDRAYITFDENGMIIISKRINKEQLKLLNIDKNIKINISNESKKYLKYHRNIFESKDKGY